MSVNETEGQVALSETAIPVTLITVMRITALIILCLNGIVLFCLCMKKQNIPRIYRLQILYLCLTDNMAGFGLLMLSFADYGWIRNDFTPCCFLFGFFVSSQSATLYSVMAICIYRFIIMLRVDKMDQHPSRNKVTCFSISVIIFSFASGFFPFFKWASRNQYPNYATCSVRAIFSENVPKAMKLYLGTFLIPLLLTNLLYGYLVFINYRKQRQTNPVTIFVSDKNSTSSTTKIHENTSRCHWSSDKQTLASTAGPASFIPVRQGCLVTTDISNTIRHTNINEQANAGVAALTTKNQVKESNSCTVAASTSGLNSERRAHQSKAVMGYILLFLNMFTLPGVTVLIVSFASESVSFSRGWVIPLVSTVSLNSIINPILYTVRIKEFREVVSDTFYCSRSRVRNQ